MSTKVRHYHGPDMDEEQAIGKKQSRLGIAQTKTIDWYKEIVLSGSMQDTQKVLIDEGWIKRRPLYLFLLAVDVTLRGIAQVFLCNHPLTGVLVCAGLAVTSWELMLYALLATAISTASAASIGRPPIADVYAGLCGYDGALVGCSCWAFFSPSYALQAAFLLPVLAGLVHVAFVHLLRTWQLPCFTFAFNVVTIMFLYASDSGAIQLQLKHAPPTLHVDSWNEMSVQYAVDASLRGVGQFMFADTTVGSALVILGIVIASRKGALIAVIGAITGWVMARYVLHASAEDNIRAGLYGYNCAGTCSALSGGIFYKTSDGALLVGIVGAVLASLLTFGFSGLLGGLPVLTFPFIVSTWIIMLSRTKWLTEADQIFRPLMRKMSSRRFDAHNQLMSLSMFKSSHFNKSSAPAFPLISNMPPASPSREGSLNGIQGMKQSSVKYLPTVMEGKSDDRSLPSRGAGSASSMGLEDRSNGQSSSSLQEDRHTTVEPFGLDDV